MKVTATTFAIGTMPQAVGESLAGGRRAFFVAICLILVLGLGLTPAVAEAGGSGGHSGTFPHFSDLKWYWFNLFLYGGGLYLLLRRPVSEGWRSRREGLLATVNRLRVELERSVVGRRAAEERVKGLDAEIRALRASVLEDAAREAAMIVAEGERKVERLRTSVEVALASERKGAVLAVRRGMAEAVVQAARDGFVASASPELHRGLRLRVAREARGLAGDRSSGTRAK